MKIIEPAMLYTDKTPVTVLVQGRGSKRRAAAGLRGKIVAKHARLDEALVAVR